MIEKLLLVLRYVLYVKLRSNIKSNSIVFIQKKVRLIVDDGGEINFGKNVLIKEEGIVYAKKNAKITFGDNTSTGHHTEISANNKIVIGENVIMGAYTYITDSNHGYKNLEVPIRKNPMEVEETIVGSNVWLGRNVMLLKGSHIGDNSIVAAGSVVTKKIPDNMIVGGVPAKILKGIYD